MTRALDFTFRASAVLAVMAIPFVIVNWCRYALALQRADFPNSRALVPFPTKTLLFFVLPGALTFITANVATASSRQKVVEFLRQPGVSTGFWAHHSHPTKRVRVQIDSSGGQLFLELGRDSRRPQEYWVFDPSGNITNLNEIGRITTSLFDSY